MVLDDDVQLAAQILAGHLHSRQHMADDVVFQSPVEHWHKPGCQNRAIPWRRPIWPRRQVSQRSAVEAGRSRTCGSADRSPWAPALRFAWHSLLLTSVARARSAGWITDHTFDRHFPPFQPRCPSLSPWPGWAHIPEGTGRPLPSKDRLVAIFNLGGGQYHAIDDLCPHMGASLAAGPGRATSSLCPWHAWRFRVTDGTWCDNPQIKRTLERSHAGVFSRRRHAQSLPRPTPIEPNRYTDMTDARLGCCTAPTATQAS